MKIREILLPDDCPPKRHTKGGAKAGYFPEPIYDNPYRNPADRRSVADRNYRKEWQKDD